MSKSASPISVLTANRLSDGAVVFLDFDGVWAESLRGAVVARSPDEARALESRGAFDAARNIVVEPYLVEMAEVAGTLVPVRFRERVRLGGPSILDDVPGYTEASSPSPHRSSRWGEGRGGAVPPARGEGRPQVSEQAAAPHPDPLPVKNGEREHLVEAA